MSRTPPWLVLLATVASCSGQGTPAEGPARGPARAAPEPAPAAPEPARPPAFVEIEAGARHTCARRDDGRVVCWGQNHASQLGRYTPEHRAAPPVTVRELSATSISAGHAHTCAVVDGGVHCWGLNESGALGDGTVWRRHAPTQVLGLEGVVEISAGAFHTCARRQDGSVLCWGGNTDGEVGAAPREAVLSPHPVPGVVASAIAAGHHHTCAVVEDGRVRCWGSNEDRQLGDGSSDRRAFEPRDVAGVTGVTALAAGGQHTCGLRSNGGIVCWGSNRFDVLGDPDADSLERGPVDVGGLDDATGLAAGDRFTCATRADGSIACWGDGGTGCLGDGEAHRRYSGNPPVSVASLNDATAVTAGASHTCALRASGAIACWGSNSNRQLGDGTDTRRLAPVEVAGVDHADRTGEELGRAPPPRLTVPERLAVAVSEGRCERDEAATRASVYEECLRRLAESDDPRSAYLYGRVRADLCQGQPTCVADALRVALLFADDEADLALVREASGLSTACRDAAEPPEGARPIEVQGPDDVTVRRHGTEGFFVTTRGRTCALPVGPMGPRRIERDGSLLLVHWTESDVGTDEGCTWEQWESHVGVIDPDVGLLLKLGVGGGSDVQCADEASSGSRRPRPVRVRLRGDRLEIGQAPRGIHPGPPTRWLLGQALTLRDGVFRLPREPGREPPAPDRRGP